MSPRRYPRTLMQAFPRDHWRGVITRHKRPLHERVADAICTTAVFAVLALVAFFGWSGGWR